MSTTIRQAPFDSTGTNIRTWAQFVEDTLIEGGWTIADDSGQTPPSVLPAPTGGGQVSLGYRIYRMDDNIFPVSMRVDFGTGNAAGYTPPPYPPGFWLTIGSGSNGVGGIIGVMLNNLRSYQTTASAGPFYCYGSADKGRCALSLFEGRLGFSIERTRDFEGLITNTGLLFTASNLYGDSGGAHVALGNSGVLLPGTIGPPLVSGLNYYHTSSNPAQIINGNKGVGLLFHFNGTAVQPGINWIVVNSGDIGAQSSINVNIYGVWHRYQQVGMVPLVGVIQVQPFAQSALVTDTGRSLMMRWE